MSGASFFNPSFMLQPQALQPQALQPHLPQAPPRPKKRMQKWSHKRSTLIVPTVSKEEARERCLKLADRSLMDKLEYLRELQTNDYRAELAADEERVQSENPPMQFPISITGVTWLLF